MVTGCGVDGERQWHEPQLSSGICLGSSVGPRQVHQCASMESAGLPVQDSAPSREELAVQLEVYSSKERVRPLKEDQCSEAM